MIRLPKSNAGIEALVRGSLFFCNYYLSVFWFFLCHLLYNKILFHSFHSTCLKKKKGICRNRTDFYSIILCTDEPSVVNVSHYSFHSTCLKKKKGICRNRTDFYSIILCTCRKKNSRGSGLIKQLHRRLFPFTIKLCALSIANMSALRRGDLAGVGVCVCTDEPSVVNVRHGVNNSVVFEVDGNSTPGSNDGSRS